MKKVTFAERLISRMKEIDISAAELSRRMDLSEAVISQYKSGKYVPKQDRLEQFARILDVSEAWLMGFDVDKSPVHMPAFTYPNILPITTKKLPLLGDIACGKPMFTDEERESYINVGTNVQADFCLKCKGDSMINARILDGDIVFIKSQPMVDNGEIAAVIIDNEATLKRVNYYPERNMLILKAENSKYSDMVYIGPELENIRILGKAVAFQSDVK